MIKEFIFESDVYFSECHCSSLIQLKNRDLLVSWFAGTKEGNNDVSIYLSKRSFKTQKWSVPKKIVDIPNLPLWNPVLTQIDDKIILFYHIGQNTVDWRGYRCFSCDGGENFSKPIELESGYLGPIKNKPVLMSNGKFLCPSSRESSKEWFGVMEIYDPQQDQFIQQEIIKVPELPRGIIQPTVWETTPGKIYAFFRSTDDCIYKAYSENYGLQWSIPQKTNLKNPNSGIDCCSVEKQITCLVFNPVGWSEELKMQARSPLVLSCSIDNGENWYKTFVLEDRLPGEFSYPAIIPGKDRDVFISYTWDRKRIAVVHFDQEEIFPKQ